MVYDLLCPNCGQPARQNEKCEYCGQMNETPTDDKETDDATESDANEADDDDATALDERNGPE